MKWTEELKNEVVDLFKLGHSFRGIAKMLTERGIPMTRNSIAGVLKRADVLGFLRPRIIKAEPEPKPEPEDYLLLSLLLLISSIDRTSQAWWRPHIPGDAYLAISRLNETSCRYPEGDPSSTDFSFCMQPALPNKSYCAGHYAIVYRDDRH